MTTEIILPTSPVDRKKLFGNVQEAALCLQRIEDQRSHYRDIVKSIKEDFQIGPKASGQMIKTYHKNNFREVQSQQQEFEELYLAIVGLDSDD
jgi:hypothetical protein